MHRIHHSREPQHFNKNFGVVTSVWDRLFGTAYFPAKDEWPDTGIVNQSEPSTVREFLFPSLMGEPIEGNKTAVTRLGHT